MRFPGNGVRDGCESSYECWRLNVGPLEERSVHLATDPSLKFWELFKPLVGMCLQTCMKKWIVLVYKYRKVSIPVLQIE